MKHVCFILLSRAGFFFSAHFFLLCLSTLHSQSSGFLRPAIFLCRPALEDPLDFTPPLFLDSAPHIFSALPSRYLLVGSFPYDVPTSVLMPKSSLPRAPPFPLSCAPIWFVGTRSTLTASHFSSHEVRACPHSLSGFLSFFFATRRRATMYVFSLTV